MARRHRHLTVAAGERIGRIDHLPLVPESEHVGQTKAKVLRAPKRVYYSLRNGLDTKALRYR